MQIPKVNCDIFPVVLVGTLFTGMCTLLDYFFGTVSYDLILGYAGSYFIGSMAVVWIIAIYRFIASFRKDPQ